jgi:hypothetical protein
MEAEMLFKTSAESNLMNKGYLTISISSTYHIASEKIKESFNPISESRTPLPYRQLSICSLKIIAKHMKAFISITSDMLIGSKITLALPCNQNINLPEADELY